LYFQHCQKQAGLAVPNDEAHPKVPKQVGQQKMMAQDTVWRLDRNSLTYRPVARLTCPDSYTLVQIQNQNLAVTYLARLRPFDDGINGLLHKVIIHGDLYPGLLQKVHFKLDAAITLAVTLLLAAPKSVRHRHFENFRLV
jgi:hypothetical protein